MKPIDTLFQRRLAAVALAVCLWAGVFSSARADVIFNEVMADNRDFLENEGGFPDWIELYNIATSSVSLDGWSLTDDPAKPRKWLFPKGTIITHRARLLIYCDGLTNATGLHASINLSAEGETLMIFDNLTTNTPHATLSFGPQVADLSIARIPDLTGPFALARPTPNAANVKAIPLGSASPLKINEWLASDWWLTDDTAEPLKFRIHTGTVIPANGFKVFYEGVGTPVGFNRTGDGLAPSFSLSSSKGNDAWLYAARSDGTLTGFRCGVVFGPAANGVSFGRHLTSQGADFVSTSANTFGMDDPATVTQFRTGTGRTNAGPKVGPIVISEMMYQPPPIIQGTNLLDNSVDEFIELCNTTRAIVGLYDPDYPTNRWRLRGGVTYDFTNNATLAANAYALLVNFNPQTNTTQLAAFRSLYSVADDVPIYGPYRGKLNNDSDTLQLERPDPPQTPGSPNAGFVPYVLVEKINYRGSFPWTTNADATGHSLQRLLYRQYGNEPTNWASAIPTAGRLNVLPIALLPRLLSLLPTEGGTVTLTWEASPGGLYHVQHQADLVSGMWQTWPAPFVATGSTVTANNIPGATPRRFYRLLLER